jgi:signal transduction histidine kinase
VPADIEVAIYRVVQEALTNVARHAGAQRVDVRLELSGGRIRLTVVDDGRGAAGNPAPHLGLLGMSERIAALAGTLEITTARDAGFRLDAAIPFELIVS